MLKLYHNITPNYTSTHYYFTDFDVWLDFLETNLLKEVDANNYLINNGFIRVKIDTTLTSANYNEVTYIINTIDNICYHVNSATLQSGYALYSVSIDNFASYLYKGTIKRINVRRCNRNLSSNGIYDDIKVTTTFTRNYISDQTYDASAFDIVIFANVTWDKGQSTEIQTQIRIATPLTSGLPAYQTEPYLIDIVEIINRFKYYAHSSDASYIPMEIKKMYIVPSYCVHTSDTERRIASTERGEGYKQAYFITDNIVIDNQTFTYNYKTSKVLVGSADGYIELNRKTNGIYNVKYLYEYAIDDMRVRVTEGLNQEDITKSFEIPVIRRNQVDATNGITKVLSYITGISKIGLGLFGSPLSLLSGINTLGGQIANETAPQKNTNTFVTDGDAILSYGYKLPFKYPYMYYTAYSTETAYEQDKAKVLGISYNVSYLPSLTDIFTYPFLETGVTDTYIIANLQIEGIPTNAINDIERRFNSGIFIQYITT